MLFISTTTSKVALNFVMSSFVNANTYLMFDLTDN